MDRLTRATDIVKAFYTYKNTGNAAPFIKDVCRYFDYIKTQPLSESDMLFLLFLANEAGIPQYYDLLKEKYNSLELSDENINMLTLSAFFHDSSLVRGDNKLHRYQKYVLDRYQNDKDNRYVLIAPTSFGKTFLVYEIIQKMKYKNILLIFPSISLLSENYAKLQKSLMFKKYQIYSLSEDEFDSETRNIFIFTPERYLSFLDKNDKFSFDFSFIDEVYKIDNSFIIDQETTGENERDTAYRLALEFICQYSSDILLAGPYMKLPDKMSDRESSFINFASENSFEFLDFNDFEIVDKIYQTIKGRQQYVIDNKTVEVGSINKAQKVANIVKILSSSSENTIIYCGRKSDTENYAKSLLQDPSLISLFDKKCELSTPDIFKDFISHLETSFGPDWIVVNALKGRIGIHHSLIPKYIQKEIINLFNQGALICLFSTTTITEGVNTTAKNIIVTSNKKGLKKLKQFDAKNIAGRAGRFRQHYTGRVIDLNNNFENIIQNSPEIIKHKNYDASSSKTDVDYQITKDRYLSKHDIVEKKHIDMEVAKFQIPENVFNSFRIIGPKDKLILYNRITHIDYLKEQLINKISYQLARSNACRFNWDGFQHVIDIITPIVHEEKLKKLITIKTGSSQNFSLITVLLHAYLSGGFVGMVNYYTKEAVKKKTIDNAIRTVADYVYNVFKYHLVKYLGIFDILYRYYISQRDNIPIVEIPGMGLLLQKLEYNALTPNARRLSDFGVPFNIIKHYDTVRPSLAKSFDVYEQYIDSEIQQFLL